MPRVGLVLVAFYLTLASKMTLMFDKSFIGFLNAYKQQKYQV
jgi:hypothetical protein